MCKHLQFCPTMTVMHHNRPSSNPDGFHHHHTAFVFRRVPAGLGLPLEDDASTQCENWLVWSSLAQVTRWCTHVQRILIFRREKQLRHNVCDCDTVIKKHICIYLKKKFNSLTRYRETKTNSGMHISGARMRSEAKLVPQAPISQSYTVRRYEFVTSYINVTQGTSI